MKCFFKTIFLFSITVFLSIWVFGCYGKSLNENAYIVMDYDTKNVLFEKNKSQKVYPASTTKILTCILALESLNLDDEITVTSAMLSEVPRGSSTMKLVSNDTMTVKDLLYGLMLPSGNDAAIVVAHLVSGNTDEFVNLMNKKLEELGCTNSHFSNPHGFHDDEHYTTAEDMAKIFMYALKNETFLEIISTGKYTIEANDAVPYDRNYTSTNQLITNTKYKIYGKTGYTDEAGNVFVSYTDHNGKKIISVLLDGNKNYYNNTYRFDDTLYINDYIFDNYSDKTIIPKETIKLKLIDNINKANYTYANKDDINLFVDSPDAKLTYSTNMNNNNLEKLNLNITGKDFYLKDMETLLTTINTDSTKSFNIDKNLIKIIALIILDLTLLFIFFILIYVIVSTVKPKKRKINKNRYNSNLYR